MIFCVGNKSVYEKYIDEDPNPRKLGRRPEGYPGGSVWRTRDEAQKFCQKGYCVYGLIADWETDTVPNEDNNPWNDLLFDAKIVRLI